MELVVSETVAVKIHLLESGPPEGGEFGTPAVMVEKNAHCDDCGEEHDIEACPDCGADVIVSFGHAGGPGFGLNKVCEQFCGWSWKRALPHDED